MAKRRRFGSIRRKESGRFQASYLDPRTNKRVYADDTFKTKTAADQWLVDIEASLRKGELPDLELGRKSFKEWSAHWLATRDIRANTESGYESTVRLYLNPQFGHMPINTIDRTDVSRYVSGIAKDPDLSAKAAKVRRIASMIFTEALRSGAIRLNPADGVRVRRGRREEKVFLSRKQVHVLAETITNPEVKNYGRGRKHRTYPEYGLMIRFVSETGLRAGEVAALRVGRLDLESHMVHVFETVAEVKKAKSPTGLLYDEPKNYERRSVPLPDELANELRQYLADRDADPDAFVFTAPDGGPLRHRNFYNRHYKPATVTAAGVPDKTRFHDLRHTYAALLIAAGANPLTVKLRMGHSSITVTMDRYGHLFPHIEEEITAKMNEAYREARQSAVVRESSEPENDPKVDRKERG